MDYTLNFNQKLRTLEGKDDDSAPTLGKMLGESIARMGIEQAKGSFKPTKLIGWSEKLTRGDELVVDKTDFDGFRAFCELLPDRTLLVIARIDEVFSAAKDAAEKK